jgi:two-component system response regulator AtoC
MATLLVIEDEEILAKNIARFFEKSGHLVEVATTACRWCPGRPAHSARCGHRRLSVAGHGRAGSDPGLRKAEDPPRIVMVTGHASVTLAVDAMKAGSMDLLTKPVTLQNLKAVVDRALAERGERRALDYYRQRDAQQASLDALVGTSIAMQSLRHLIRTVSNIEPADQSPAAPILMSGRNRHRQGAGGPCLPPGRPTGQGAVHRNQLRSTARAPDRGRAVRV